MRTLQASDGKVFKSKITGEILSNFLYLGKEDKAENYEQVDQPVENQE